MLWKCQVQLKMLIHKEQQAQDLTMKIKDSYISFLCSREMLMVGQCSVTHSTLKKKKMSLWWCGCCGVTAVVLDTELTFKSFICSEDSTDFWDGSKTEKERRSGEITAVNHLQIFMVKIQYLQSQLGFVFFVLSIVLPSVLSLTLPLLPPFLLVSSS